MSRILVICQVYVPDTAAVGQQVADACALLASRGHDVTVITADRGYDDPSQRYAARERRDGVSIRRLGFCSFGKRSAVMRLLGGVSFTVQSAILGIMSRRPDIVVVSTAPPMSPLAALAVAVLRRAELVYWVMDLNPDQAVAMRHFAESSLIVRALNWMQRQTLRRAREVVVLDRFMEARVRQKGVQPRHLSVVPPWPHEDQIANLPHQQNPFRQHHSLCNCRVVMYSGNHTTTHPLDTLLSAADRLRDHDTLRFLFVGGGVAKRQVDAISGGSIVSLPYQPLEQLTESLSAADVHVVTMGNDVVGISHPSKIYGAMAMSRPILFIGPDRCHVADIVKEHRVGWHVHHGDVDGLVAVLRQIAEMPQEELQAMGRRAADAVRRLYSRETLRRSLCDAVAPGASIAS